MSLILLEKTLQEIEAFSFYGLVAEDTHYNVSDIVLNDNSFGRRRLLCFPVASEVSGRCKCGELYHPCESEGRFLGHSQPFLHFEINRIHKIEIGGVQIRKGEVGNREE